MTNTRMERIRTLADRYLVRLLLLAVVLTAGFALRYAALAKYTSYLYDFTGAVAGDFCFTSNYLADESLGRQFTIGGWDANEPYELELEIRNYENSLRFNEAGVDACYYLDVQVQYDETGSGSWTEDPDAKTTLTFSKNKIPVTPGTYTLQNEEQETIGEYPCVMLDGMDQFERASGTSRVNVLVKGFSEPTKNHRVIITARTIPTSRKDGITGMTGYTGTGVYDTKLVGTFVLSRDMTIPDFTENCYRPASNDRGIVYQISCQSLSGTSTTKLCIYYDPDVMYPSTTMLSREFGEDSDVLDGTGQYAGYKYFTVEIQSNCTKRLDFYTYELEYDAGSAITSKDLCFVIIDDAAKSSDDAGGGPEE